MEDTLHKLPEDLFVYQKEDFRRLQSTEESFLQLSEMGTGKTPVSIALATLGSLSKQYRKILVMCPKTVRLEWARQIKDWTGEEPAVSRRGCYRRLEPLFDDMRGIKPFNPWFIVNYETFRTKRHLEVLNNYPFDLIIMDEAHKLRNPKTKVTKGVFEFLKNHPDSRVIAMTGSPIVNYPGDLHTLLCMVRPQEYSRINRPSFVNYYSIIGKQTFLRCMSCKQISTNRWNPICPHCGSSSLKSFTSDKVLRAQNLSVLREKTDSFTIRRTKKEVLPFLPDKYYRKVMLEMSTEQRKIYNQMEKELFVLLDSGEPLYAACVLAQLTRLRQLNVEPRILKVEAPSAKTDFLMELIEELEGQKLVIFTCFEEYAQYLHFDSRMPKHLMITGKTPPDDRVKIAQEFQTNPDIQVIIGTVQVMGEAITLTAASNVIMMDRWWSPAANAQAEDRLHRITQTSGVQVIIPILENSVDQSLDTILEKKKRMAQDYLGSDSTITNSGIMAETLENLRKSRDGETQESSDEDTDDEEESEG